MNWAPLRRLSPDQLDHLARSLQGGRLRTGRSELEVGREFPGHGPELAALLAELAAQGMDSEQMALLVQATLAEREAAVEPSQLVELVLSGPYVPTVPTAATAAQLRGLFTSAVQEVLVVGYAFYNGAKFFAPLVQRLREVPGFRVRFVVNIHPTDDGDPLAARRQAAAEFRKHHWPWPEPPEIYYDPRSLAQGDQRASLHAKCIVADRHTALITSANYTDAAQERNIEAGVLVRYPPVAKRLADYFEALIASGHLSPLTD